MLCFDSYERKFKKFLYHRVKALLCFFESLQVVFKFCVIQALEPANVQRCGRSIEWASNQLDCCILSLERCYGSNSRLN